MKTLWRDARSGRDYEERRKRDEERKKFFPELKKIYEEGKNQGLSFTPIGEKRTGRGRRDVVKTPFVTQRDGFLTAFSGKQPFRFTLNVFHFGKHFRLLAFLII